MSRLQNRVLLLQRELEMLRGPRGRGAHMEPMVPEKQFQQLTTAHAKVGFLGCGMAELKELYSWIFRVNCEFVLSLVLCIAVNIYIYTLFERSSQDTRVMGVS